MTATIDRVAADKPRHPTGPIGCPVYFNGLSLQNVNLAPHCSCRAGRALLGIKNELDVIVPDPANSVTKFVTL